MGEGIQVRSNEGSRPFPRISRITEHLGQFQQNLAQSILEEDSTLNQKGQFDS